MTKSSYLREIIYGTYEIDNCFNILAIDKTFELITGYTKEDVEKQRLSHLDLIPKEDVNEYLNLVEKLLTKKQEAYIEHRIVRKDGQIIYVFCLGRNNIDENGKFTGATIRITRVDRSLSYIEKRREYKETLNDEREKANLDDLTGLYRRKMYEEKIKLEQIKERLLGFFLIDVDDFKNINDTFGHTKGDEILIAVSEVMKRVTRLEDLTCRLGGDEFSMTVINRTNKEVLEIAKRLISEINSIRIEEDPSYKIGVSIGIANYIDSNTNFTEMYKKADKALYKSKEKGKNTYTLSRK